MITINNYFKEIESVGIHTLPETLQKSHEFVLKSTDNGSHWNSYHSSEPIKRVIDLHISKLNEFISSRPTVKSAPQKNKKVNTPKPNKEKAPTKERVKKEKIFTGRKVEVIGEEVKFIKRFVGLHNRVKSENAVLNLIKALQKSIVQKLIKKTSPLAANIQYIQEKLVKAYNNRQAGSDMKIVINEADLGKFVSIAGGEQVFASIPIIKRFIGMQGKYSGDEKIVTFINHIEKSKKNDKFKDDPYEDKVKNILKALKQYKFGSERQLLIAQAELNGLSGIVKACSCQTSVGQIYHTSGKKLRGCKSRSYSDAGKGACSHHRGLSGIVTGEDIMNREYEMLNFNSQWSSLIGKPEKNFTMMIHGEPGSGKTTFLMKFIKYLSTLGSGLYVSSEEFDSVTLKDKIQQFLSPIPSNIHFASNVQNVNLGKYGFVVLDSITDLGMNLEDFKALKATYPNTAFILILQHTKDGKFKGGKEWEHEVQIAGHVANGTINIYKNRYGVKGSLNFFDN